MLSVGLGLLRSRRSDSGITSGVVTGKLRGLFFCLLSGIILLEFITRFGGPPGDVTEWFQEVILQYPMGTRVII